MRYFCSLMTSTHSIAGKSFPLANEEGGKLKKCKHKVNVLFAYIVHLYLNINTIAKCYLTSPAAADKLFTPSLFLLLAVPNDLLIA